MDTDRFWGSSAYFILLQPYIKLNISITLIIIGKNMHNKEDSTIVTNTQNQSNLEEKAPFYVV